MTKGWMIKIESNRQIPSLPTPSWVKSSSLSEAWCFFLSFFSPLHFNTFILLCPENYFGLRQLIYSFPWMKAEAWIMQNDTNAETVYI